MFCLLINKYYILNSRPTQGRIEGWNAMKPMHGRSVNSKDVGRSRLTHHHKSGWNEMNEMSVEKWWNEICGSGNRKKPRENPVQTPLRSPILSIPNCNTIFAAQPCNFGELQYAATHPLRMPVIDIAKVWLLLKWTSWNSRYINVNLQRAKIMLRYISYLCHHHHHHESVLSFTSNSAPKFCPKADLPPQSHEPRLQFY